MQRRISRKPGSEIARHPRVGDERDDLTALDPLRQLDRARRFVALVDRDQRRRRADAELVEQAAGAAGVLAGDVVGGDERVADADRDVVEVADRGRADDQRPGHQPSPCSSSIRAIAAAPIMPGVVAELGRDHRGLVHRPQRPRLELAPGRVEQQVAGGDHAAADHDHFRLEDVGEAGEGDAEAAADQLEDADRGLVAVLARRR